MESAARLSHTLLPLLTVAMRRPPSLFLPERVDEPLPLRLRRAAEESAFVRLRSAATRARC